MATTKLYLDTRGVKEGNDAPLKIAITKHGNTAYFSLGIKLNKSQWDSKACKVVNHDNKNRLNSFVQNMKTQFDNTLLELESKCLTGGLNATQLKNKIASILTPSEEEKEKNLFIYNFRRYTENCNKSNTKRIYNDTVRKIVKFSKKAEQLSFEDITKGWLDDFERFLSKEEHLSINTISIHMRNIRAVINDAIDNDITNNYPFRKKKIKNEPTRKRSLSVERLRELFNYPVENFQEKYIDTFKLCFYLIGINIVDLCNLTHENMIDGRIEYIRSKTGKKYNIKVEKEAMNIINKYKGTIKLVNFSEKCKTYRVYATSLDRGLKHIGPVKISNKKKKEKIRTSAFKGLSIYWARHTWATIAASLDIPKETISAALGHGYGNKTTAIYINFDTKKIDEANRRVIDYILYNKV